jgi:hypothetical protein
MGEVIQFPKKDDFAAMYRGKIPDSILDEMLLAYDRVVELKNQYPSAEFSVSSEDEEAAKKLASDFQSYTVLLLGNILKLEAELCLERAAK